MYKRWIQDLVKYLDNGKAITAPKPVPGLGCFFLCKDFGISNFAVIAVLVTFDWIAFPEPVVVIMHKLIIYVS